jgi:hypothetical protein
MANKQLNPWVNGLHNVTHDNGAVCVSKQKIVDEKDGESGSDSGTITLSVEQLNAYLQACFNKERRRIQQKFAPVPFSDDPNNLLGKRILQTNCGELPCRHPVFAWSQQFSGDHPKISANPLENPQARERFPELRHENQLRKNLGFAKRKSVTLSR